MANIPIWPGSSTFAAGETPFGFYDLDPDFQTDADKVATFVTRRLGYPLMDVELQDINIYAAFEEAVTTYGNELYAYKVRENYLYTEGNSTSITANNKLISPNMGTTIRIAQQYGEEAGVGGDVKFHTGSIDLVRGKQYYNLDNFATKEGLETYDLEIKRVYYESPPAVTRFFDPYAGSGTGMINMLDSFGFGQFSPAINFLLMPVSFDMQRIQAIEFNDQVRKSQYSFNIVGNELQIFPIPDGSVSKLFLKYIKKSDRNNPYKNPQGSGVITDVSKVPYQNPEYMLINSIGRKWVFDYSLALCKEMLGYIRGKYQVVPIPNADTTLNHADLITAATAEKNSLVERLRAYFEETSREKLLERKNLEADAINKDLGYSPYVIYIG
tara:strand:+ start:6869 stop:8020 length:1152 start_codon:yes stop_codon:yes gene_type:complete